MDGCSSTQAAVFGTDGIATPAASFVLRRTEGKSAKHLRHELRVSTSIEAAMSILA